MRVCGLILLVGLAGQSGFAGERPSNALNEWLAAQGEIRSWSAEVVQKRKLKTLVQPLTATGRVWFSAPNRFRWELGEPAETVAIRGSDQLLILYPQLMRAERFPAGSEAKGAWRDALALLETGFPRSEAELKAQYDIVSQEVAADVCRLTLRPRSSQARKMIPKIQVEFQMADFVLLATELQLADGSRMRNEFRNQKKNPDLDPELFSTSVPSGFKVTEPLKRK